jgi:hypothetical protein
MTFEEIRDALLDINSKRCDPPMDEDEVVRIAKSVCRYEPEPDPRVTFTGGGASSNGKPNANGTTSTPPADAAVAQTGAEIILAWLRQRYQPVFRRGLLLVCNDGLTIKRTEACGTPDSAVIRRLASATDAPRFGEGGAVKVQSLPTFFNKWGPVAWGDLVASLPTEDDAGPEGTALAADEFRRLMMAVLLSEFTLARKVKDERGLVESRIEHRSAISWCLSFAKPGPWRSIRSKCLWCKAIAGAHGVLAFKIAFRPGLLTQLKADRRLTELRPSVFTDRAVRYGVATRGGADRPHGMRALILTDEFVADLTDGVPDDPEEFDTDNEPAATHPGGVKNPEAEKSG